MKRESKNDKIAPSNTADTFGLPSVADRANFEAELDRLRVREKAHTREGDAIAAARRPWYSAHASLDALLVGRQIGLFHLVCYLRDGDRVFETYWTKRRGVEAMDYSYALMDLTVYGRQEPWEDSPPRWPQQCSITRTDGGPPDWPPVSVWPGGRPIAQWSRLEAGRSDDLTVKHRSSLKRSNPQRRVQGPPAPQAPPAKAPTAAKPWRRRAEEEYE